MIVPADPIRFTFPNEDNQFLDIPAHFVKTNLTEQDRIIKEFSLVHFEQSVKLLQNQEIPFNLASSYKIYCISQLLGNRTLERKIADLFSNQELTDELKNKMKELTHSKGFGNFLELDMALYASKNLSYEALLVVLEDSNQFLRRYAAQAIILKMAQNEDLASLTEETKEFYEKITKGLQVDFIEEFEKISKLFNSKEIENLRHFAAYPRVLFRCFDKRSSSWLKPIEDLEEGSVTEHALKGLELNLELLEQRARTQALEYGAAHPGEDPALNLAMQAANTLAFFRQHGSFPIPYSWKPLLGTPNANGEIKLSFKKHKLECQRQVRRVAVKMGLAVLLFFTVLADVFLVPKARKGFSLYLLSGSFFVAPSATLMAAGSAGSYFGMVYMLQGIASRCLRDFVWGCSLSLLGFGLLRKYRFRIADDLLGYKLPEDAVAERLANRWSP